MAQITIMKKPDWVSFDEIAEVLHEAHKENLAKGLLYSAGKQTAEEIEKRLHGKGNFFIAITDENKVVGVSAIELKEKSKKWYGRQKPYGVISMEGVLPEYQGRGINSMLRKAICDYAFQTADYLIFDTAEKNTKVIRMNQKRGWIAVDYRSRNTNNFYSVVMAKWKDGCPFSRLFCMKKYLEKRHKIRKKYTEYGQLRQHDQPQ